MEDSCAEFDLGRQDIPDNGREGLKYGQSVTDGTSPLSLRLERPQMLLIVACIAWEVTTGVLDRLREGVRARRSKAKGPNAM